LIADTGNNEVREVSAAGVITRVAGIGTVGKRGDRGLVVDAELSGAWRGSGHRGRRLPDRRHRQLLRGAQGVAG
jgi:hypothetical protein